MSRWLAGEDRSDDFFFFSFFSFNYHLSLSTLIPLPIMNH